MTQLTKKTNDSSAQVLSALVDAIKQQPDMANVTFRVHTKWENGDGFKITTTGKDLQMGGQTVQREKPFTVISDFPEVMGGRSDGPTVCEMCMASIGSCISQTIIAYATMMGIELDRISVETEGNVDMRGWTGISDKVRPGAEEFRLNFYLESKTASKEQLQQLYELGKRFSPAIDTLAHGTKIGTTISKN